MPNHIKPRLSCSIQVILLWDRPDSVPRWSKRRVAGWAWVAWSQQTDRMVRIKGRRYGINVKVSNVCGRFSVSGFAKILIREEKSKPL